MYGRNIPSSLEMGNDAASEGRAASAFRQSSAGYGMTSGTGANNPRTPSSGHAPAHRNQLKTISQEARYLKALFIRLYD